MTSIYQEALGSEFSRLHPQMQRRFGFASGDGIAHVGNGIMDEIWRGRLYTLPFLYVGTWRRIMFPDRGRNIPFRIENFAYRDSLGRETVTWLRTFSINGRKRRFDAYMIYSQSRGLIVDYLGSHQHLAVDIELQVDERGGLSLKSGDQRFYERAIGFRFPAFFSGVAEVCEWFDDEDQRFHIDVRVTNSRWGPLFGYRGSFTIEELSGDDAKVPAYALPHREEARE